MCCSTKSSEEVNGKKAAWGHAIGGVITQAMASACAEQGIDIRLNTPVAEVLAEKGRAVGTVLENGEVVRARAVTSDLHPRLLFDQLVDPAVVQPFSASGLGAMRPAPGRSA